MCSLAWHTWQGRNWRSRLAAFAAAADLALQQKAGVTGGKNKTEITCEVQNRRQPVC